MTKLAVVSYIGALLLTALHLTGCAVRVDWYGISDRIEKIDTSPAKAKDDEEKKRKK